MRGKSHHKLGEYLIKRYMPDVPKSCIRAFLIGCVEPDRNPATYLKGSFRYQWLRGHNYRNARRLMRKLSFRLENKESLSWLDYFALGKLIHYTADSFTYAHNLHFSSDLSKHREYEMALQEHFLRYLAEDPEIDVRLAHNIMEALGHYHREYCRQDQSIHTDAKYTVTACSCVLAILFSKGIL